MAREPAYQLLFNLVDNAVKFAAPESDVRVTSRGEGDRIVVEVANVGTPIDPADRDRIFDAFVQGDSSSTRRHGGIGLGLHIARKIVTAYGGRIGLFGEGPVVILRAWLPRAEDSDRPAPPTLSINLDAANHQ
jgi:signal transduction histidine kinase